MDCEYRARLRNDIPLSSSLEVAASASNPLKTTGIVPFPACEIDPDNERIVAIIRMQTHPRRDRRRRPQQEVAASVGDLGSCTHEQSNEAPPRTVQGG